MKKLTILQGIIENVQKNREEKPFRVFNSLNLFKEYLKSKRRNQTSRKSTRKKKKKKVTTKTNKNLNKIKNNVIN